MGRTILNQNQMRQIEFRGLRTDGKEWVYGSLEVRQSVMRIGGYIITPPTPHDPGGDTVYEYSEVIPETVGQFTGLHDKDGKKIFEGDVVSLGLKHAYFVVYENAAFYLYHTYLSDFNGGLLRWGLLNRVNDADIQQMISSLQIIDNIHEHPELLNETK